MEILLEGSYCEQHASQSYWMRCDIDGEEVATGDAQPRCCLFAGVNGTKSHHCGFIGAS
jgi:hypothetical protein